MKKVRVILSKEAELAFKELNEHAVHSKINKSILKSIKNKGSYTLMWLPLFLNEAGLKIKALIRFLRLSASCRS